ncbi:glycosyl hydrolase family 28 protein [Chitinophagaceae bacterium LB-8]|uniref:Glycosyl hydrolase family 28 protein n=1 Tax=Paraflavisolibacter caeni TaxID=2982496 RepID=A0A9X2XVP1_9BACT|nr:glycosyl hydrolase family 28 protein [Paraflavisolibacter caeni]MCU7550219.1 glycosyl hydrolase family 28 protein [Paraflavisolibacter caeni]
MELLRIFFLYPIGKLAIFRRVRVICCLSMVLTTGVTCAQVEQIGNLKAYQAPVGALLNHDFLVKVRLPGQSWQTIPTYLIKVDQVKDAKHSTENASMAYFDFSGEVEVAVNFVKGKIKSTRIRPLSYNIKQVTENNTIRFKLRKPMNLSVEVNGDIFHNLHLFANQIDNFKPDKADTNIIYYGPGMHELPGGSLHISSGKTVYLAGGAVLKGQLLINDAKNVRVLGSGMVDQSVKMGVRIANSRNVSVEGIFCTQCFTGGSDSVAIRNVKSVSYFGWGDGMNVISSSNVLIDGVFNRNSDDCTTVYGTRLGFTGSSKNITMRNSTLWADVAHPILIGTHGNTPVPETLENLKYSNIDILDHKEAQLDYQGCMSINAGDNNLVRNVHFENIRVEDFRQGQLLNLRVFFNSKYCTAPGRGIENVLFKNVTYNGNHAELSIISGYDKDRKVKNIIFENLVINGKPITDDMKGKPTWYKTSDMARIFTGEFVEGIVFRKAGSEDENLTQSVPNTANTQ